MIVGLAAGVSVMVGFRVVIQAVNVAFEANIMAVVGEAELQLTAPGGELAVDMGALAQVRAHPGVAAAIAIIDATVPRADNGEGLRLIGMDFSVDRIEEIYRVSIAGIDDPLELLNDPKAILVPPGASLQVGDTIRVVAPTGPTDLRVAGVLSQPGALGGLNQPVAVLDLFAAQALLGLRGDVASYIDIVPRPQTSLVELRSQLNSAVGATYDVDEPLGRAGYRERALSAFQTIVDGYVLMALMVAAFIAYSAISTAMVTRGRMVGQLRTAGVRRSEIRLMVLGEAAIIGVLASALGVVAGLALARVLSDALLRTMEIVYLTRLSTAELTATSMDIGLAFAGGVSTAIVAALIPAQRVSQLDPVEAVSNVKNEYRPHGMDVWKPTLLALVFWILLVPVIYLESAYRSQVLGNVAAVICFAGIACLCPAALALVSRRLSPVIDRWFGAAGEVATMHMSSSAPRTSWVVGLIALVMTAIISLGGVFRSFETSAESWVGDYLAGDLTVSSTHTRGGWLEEPQARALLETIAAVDGVESVDTWRLIPGQDMGGVRIGIQAVSKSFLIGENYARWFVDGDVGRALRDVREGKGVLISESVTRHTNVSVGDVLELTTPSGRLRVPVSGIVVDYANDRGVVLLSADTLEKWWRDDRVTRFLVRVERGVTVDSVRAGITASLGDESAYKVLPVAELLDYHRERLYVAFGSVDVLYTVLLVPTGVGLLLFLFTNFHDRRRDIARLVGQGVTRKQLVTAIVLELGVVMIAGLGLGLGGGFVSGSLWVKYHLAYLLGWVLDFGFPWAISLRGVSTILGVCSLALLLPLWQLRQLDVAAAVAEDA